MRWNKLGRVFVSRGEHPWMHSHAANPVAEVMDSRTVRIYFSSRDERNRSHVASVVISLEPPFNPRELPDHPLLSPGDAGAFDDSGVSVGCVVTHEGVKRLYYLGWNLGVTVPFRNAIGSATWDDRSQAFERDNSGPLIDRSIEDPFSLSYPMVIPGEEKNSMWYGSHLSWGETTEDMIHAIRFAGSPDALHWIRHSEPVMSPNVSAGEIAVARPWVVPDGDLLRMWYCRRGAHYRLGYAESRDGIAWTRLDDEVGIEPSSQGWDSGSISYPSLFDVDGSRYLLYCGNGYGREGFGMAILEQD